MHTSILILIILFGTASYAVGISQMLRGQYRPSVFSRVIWLLLAVNSFAGVLISHGTRASILLSILFLIGNASVCIVSFWKGERTIGKLEYVCLALLGLSGLVWLVLQAPLVNLSIGLIAHFIGAIPTYQRVWKNGSSESTGFWSLFFIASLLSVADGFGKPMSLILFPIYFTAFDGSMTVLSSRKNRS